MTCPERHPTKEQRNKPHYSQEINPHTEVRHFKSKSKCDELEILMNRNMQHQLSIYGLSQTMAHIFTNGSSQSGSNLFVDKNMIKTLKFTLKSSQTVTSRRYSRTVTYCQKCVRLIVFRMTLICQSQIVLVM